MNVLRASAGSGKTYNLTLQYLVRLLIEGKSYFSNILAVTFTKDATEEMKFRILSNMYEIAEGRAGDLVEDIQDKLPATQKKSEQEIQNFMREALVEILHNYTYFNVGTIDSFFQKILRNLARELGKGSKFNIDLNEKQAIKDAVHNLLVNAKNKTDLMNWLTTFVYYKISEGKSWSIENDLEEFGLLAFKESYQIKENKLLEAIKDNPNILKDTIKKCKDITSQFETCLKDKATQFFNEMDKQGMDKKNFSGSLIPNYFQRFRNNNYNEPIGKKLQEQLNDPNKILTAKNRTQFSTPVNNTFHPLFRDTEDYRTQNMPLYNSAKLYLENIYQLGLLSSISKELEKNSRENNRFMLQNTAIVLNAMIDDEQDSTFIYEKIGMYIKSIMIDEFQDTSSLQWKNFKSLINEIISSGKFALLVGDVKQSIYRWRNSDWNILNNIKSEFNNVKINSLDTNWRSAKNVVEFNNELFAYMAQNISDTFKDELKKHNMNNPFSTAYGDVEQNVNKKDDLDGYVYAEICEQKNPVLDRLTETLQNLADKGYPAEQICILCRTNKEIENISEHLKQNPINGENYSNIVTDNSFSLASSPVIQIIISALKYTANTADKIAERELESLCEALSINPRTEELKDIKLYTLYDIILDIINILELSSKENHSGYLFMLLDKILEYQKDHSSDINLFIKYWEEELYAKTISNTSLKGINIMTIHKSKGLEFNTIIIPYFSGNMIDANDNIVWSNAKQSPFDLPIFPLKYSNKTMPNSIFNEEYLSEKIMCAMDNINVYYVACTRAIENLFIFSKPKSNGDYIYLENLLQDIIKFDQGKYQKGELKNFSQKQRNQLPFNPFSKNMQIKEVFVPYRIANNKNKQGNSFIQSNASREFIQGEDSTKNSFVIEGNILHNIFSRIITTHDIDNAIDRLIFDGIITNEDKNNYLNLINKAIEDSRHKEWFDGTYQVMTEQEILTKDSSSNEIKTYRPDRIMISKDKTIVVDYKFGQHQEEQHKKQIEKYMSLLKEIQNSEVEGYLWYVKTNTIIKIE